MATSNTAIKITQLPNIGNAIAPSTLIPVVNMAGVPVTQKANLQITGNLILAGAGTANFVPARLSNLAYSIVNAAQPNITSVGTLTGLTIGNFSNLHIPGGNNGQYLQTDGTGNLAWVNGGGSGNGEVGGANTQIQYNNDGDFDGDPDLAWVDGNIVTTGIKTDGYFYANGAPFTGGGGGGGNTGNITFSAANISTNLANTAIQIIGNGTGNINVSANNKTWTFDNIGNLNFPGNIVGSANANFVIYSNSGAHEFTFADDGTFYAPDNVVLGGPSIFIGAGANTLTGFDSAVFLASSDSAAYVQAAIVNVSDIGSADWAAYGHRGNDNGGWVDLGFTSSGYSDPYYTITGPGDGSLIVETYYDGQSPGGRGGNLIIGTGSQGTVNDIIFGTGGFLIENEFARISDANNALEFYDGGNITGANVIGANTFAIAGGTTLNQVEGPNTVGFYNSEANTQFLFELGSSKVWGFNGNTGGTIFPQLSVQRGDNPSGTITGQTLLFDSSSQEAIITTPDGVDDFNSSSQRLVINPGAGAANTAGEGGDIYLWAGRGGNGSGSGGDIKIRGGQGGSNSGGGSGGDGGYIRIEAGDADSSGGAAGYIQITGGVAGYVTPGIAGGSVTITGGQGQNGDGGITTIQGGYGGTGYHGGNVQINGGGTSSGQSSEGNVHIQTGGNTWTFDSLGNLTLPAGGIVHETGIPFGGLSGNTIALKPAGGTNADQQLLVYPTAGQDFNHLHLTSGNLYNTELFLGDDNFNVKLANTGNIVINTNDNAGNISQWTFNPYGVILTDSTLFLQTPNGIPNTVTAITGSSGSWESNPKSDLATTGGTGTGLTVDVGETGGYASTIAIHTPGTGYTNGDTITVTSGSSNATFTISIVNNEWTFGTDGSLTLPTISLGTNLDEQTVIQSQRKIIPPFRWSTEISGGTPTIVYTVSSNNITSMKVTMQIQHTGLGMELFDVYATMTGADTFYTVSNRVAPPTINNSTILVNLNGSNEMQIRVSINSGAATSWVTYDSTEFGVPQD